MKFVRQSMYMFIALGLSACAPLLWTKSGGTQDEFSRDKYACLQDSQQRESGAYVNEYSGTAHSSVTINEQLFAACMNARGWYLSRAAPQQPTQLTTTTTPQAGVVTETVPRLYGSYSCLRDEAFKRRIDTITFGEWVRSHTDDQIKRMEDSCLDSDNKAISKTFSKFKRARKSD